MYSSAEKTASPPMETLSAPDRKYFEATSNADQTFPSESVYSLIPPPTYIYIYIYIISSNTHTHLK